MAKWFEKSEREREVALLLFDKGYYPETCFHCHMAVELKFKGILVEKTGAVIYTHSLKRILQEVQKVKDIKITDEILDCANYLSMLYTGSRYPEESLIDMGKEEGEKCVKCMEKLLSL
ncbi:MAG: HEPN domain-containing protein [Saccharolobus sp.]|uniref:HEPN domain-containing protein n=1 Tax=Saccharolobus TaxID=2100760 RepID=UPI001F117E1C|nr:HEPN domain-containing protein [Saccharolobus shibatae]MCH4816045.1 HEPN domain-containing protein [Saccharolobus shibatae]